MSRLWADLRDIISIIVLFGLIAFVSAPARAGAQGLQPLSFDYGPERLDVYVPEGLAAGARAPVVVFVHGGGWLMGNRKHLHRKDRYFTGQGYVFVSVGYRLYPRVRIPDQVEDVARALGWVRAHIGRYGGDPDNVHMMGHSAGAHLAALAIMSGRAGPLRSAILNDSKVLDVDAYAASLSRGQLPAVYREVFGPRTGWATRSPARYLDRGAAVDLPPILLAWSGKAEGKRHTLMEAFAAKVRGAGGRAMVFAGTGYRHLSINSRIGRSGDAFTGVIAGFLAQHAR